MANVFDTSYSGLRPGEANDSAAPTARGGNVKQTYTDPRVAALLPQTANMDPAQKYLFAEAHNLPAASFGLNPGQIYDAAQGLNGITMDKNTGQVMRSNADGTRSAVDPSTLMGTMNTNLGGTGQIGTEADSQWRLGQPGSMSGVQPATSPTTPPAAQTPPPGAPIVTDGPGNSGAPNAYPQGGAGAAQNQASGLQAAMGYLGNQPAQSSGGPLSYGPPPMGGQMSSAKGGPGGKMGQQQPSSYMGYSQPGYGSNTWYNSPGAQVPPSPSNWGSVLGTSPGSGYGAAPPYQPGQPVRAMPMQQSGGKGGPGGKSGGQAMAYPQ